MLAGQGNFGIDKDDAELVSKAAKGDIKAFESLLQKHRQRILAICLRMLGDRAEAEEAAQDSFVKIYYHLKNFDPSRSFVIWSASISINECRDRLRKRSRSRKLFREISEAESISSLEFGAACEDCDQRLGNVEQALEKLPPKLKEVIVLKAYGNYSYEDIARTLKIKVGTVMSRLFRARQKLTDILNRGV